MRPERGFGLVAALFLIVIIAAVIAVMWRLAATQSATNDMGLQQARAYQAARAGIEYGIARSLNGNACTSLALQGFAITVTCTLSQGGDPLVEEGRTDAARFFVIEAQASFAAPGDPDYAYRRLRAVVEDMP